MMLQIDAVETRYIASLHLGFDLATGFDTVASVDGENFRKVIG